MVLAMTQQQQAGRRGGLTRALKHTPAEMGEWARQANWRRDVRAVDPDGTLPADELARRVALLRTLRADAMNQRKRAKRAALAQRVA